jgi:hypothetical protein
VSDRRRAIIQLAEDELGQLLDLPDGYRVLFVGADFPRQAVMVVVGSDELQTVPPGIEPPLLGGYFSQKRAVVDGEVYFRWTWNPKDPE